MAPKKVKASEMLKIAEVMKKKAKAESFNKGMPLVILDPPTVDAVAASESAHVKHGPLSPPIEPSRKRPCEVKFLVPSPPPLKAINANNLNYARINKLKGAYTKMEVKKVQLGEALKSLDSAIKEQEAQHQAEIGARDAEWLKV
ncbi:hypothetical protein JCGZ_18597 [Jatropha curcas]|uniref:Uncharacterized protein n=1 Tax=Jatropha curcas TaxID=180498 RepID=A0A067K4W5_JATCU|nr:hypothetical protein JCGZ_18597 [Jatropha curcas]